MSIIIGINKIYIINNIVTCTIMNTNNVSLHWPVRFKNYTFLITITNFSNQIETLLFSTYCKIVGLHLEKKAEKDMENYNISWNV